MKSLLLKNRKKYINRSIPVFLLFILLFASCNKKELLDAKPSTKIFEPKSLKDLQALLDYSINMNETPVLGEISSDIYFMTTSGWQGAELVARNAYIWAQDIFEGSSTLDWNKPYRQILHTNVVLENLNDIAKTTSNEQEWNQVRGNALFMRAYAFYHLAQVFAPAYDNMTSGTDLGIPLKLNSDINQLSVRSTVQETYNQILSDLNEAKSLVYPTVIANQKIRPSKPAVYAMLARVYLSMRDYEKAKLNADNCLQLYGTLIDYNTVPTSSTLYQPFQRDNAETIYQTRLRNDLLIYLIFSTQHSIDTILYNSYDNNDLRKIIYFFKQTNGAISTHGTYSGGYDVFSGLASDEIFLIRAECRARSGDVNGAMSDLNLLLKNRFKTGFFTQLTASDPSDALSKVLTERKKELVFRGRWTDLRRLNKEGANITISRIINGQTHTLSPNDPKYVLPIPPDVIAFTGMTQNPR